MTAHVHLSAEDATLYVLGSLTPDENLALDAAAAECDTCAHELADASLALERVALETSAVHGAHRSDPRKASMTTPRWYAVAGAIAAALTIALLSLRVVLLSGQVHQNGPALAAIVHSHFGHAAFVRQAPAAPAAKVLYAQDGSWLYVVVDRPAQHLTVRADGESIGEIQASGTPATLFVARAGGRPRRLTLTTAEGRQIAAATLIYTRTPSK